MQTIVQLPIAHATPAVDLPHKEVVAYQPETAMQDWELTPIQRQSLEALAIFHHATADLLLRKMKRSPKSIRQLQKSLKEISPEKKEEQFVEIGFAPKQRESRFGSAPFVYRLGQRGYAYLRQEGFPVGRYRQSEASLHREIPLRHRLAVNEFLLKALQLEEEIAGVYLREYMHEKEWNANPLRVKMLTDLGMKHVFDPQWKDDPQIVKELIEKGYATARKVSSDLLLHYQIEHPKKQYRLLPEINLSPVWEKDWRDRVRAYLNCMAAYEERFGTRLLTAIPVMVASAMDFPRRDLAGLSSTELAERKREAAKRKNRMDNLVQYTEAELSKLGAEAEADLFMFSSAPLDEVTPYELFFTPLWIIPFDATPRPLMRYERGDDDS